MGWSEAMDRMDNGTNDRFTLYDLKVEVVATDRPMVCDHRVWASIFW